MDIPVEIISQTDQLHTAIKEIANSRVIALDTESNSYHRYPEQLCLIQIATPSNVFIIDTLSIEDISLLEDILSCLTIIKIIHGADYDIRSLDRHHGFHARNIFDTAIAARFVGIKKFALADLIKNLLNITIDKSKRFQKSNWGHRPLSNDALIYAANDVSHLIRLRGVLIRRLQSMGQITWVNEECSRFEDIRYEAPDLDTAYLSVKGASRLDGSNLTLLKTLFLFREKEALRQHRPPYFIMPDATLIHIATDPKNNLSEIPELGQKGLKRFGRGLKQAIKRGLTAPPIHRTSPFTNEEISEADIQRLKLMREEQERRFKRLKAWRTSIGAMLSLDPSLIWPTASLERLSKDPNTYTVELISSDIRQWQRDQFAHSLSALLKSF